MGRSRWAVLSKLGRGLPRRPWLCRLARLWRPQNAFRVSSLCTNSSPSPWNSSLELGGGHGSPRSSLMVARICAKFSSAMANVALELGNVGQQLLHMISAPVQGLIGRKVGAVGNGFEVGSGHGAALTALLFSSPVGRGAPDPGSSGAILIAATAPLTHMVTIASAKAPRTIRSRPNICCR